MSEMSELSVQKFHPIVGRLLGVALEATVTEPVRFLKPFFLTVSDLVYRKITPEFQLCRMYYPAVVETFIIGRLSETVLTFNNWFEAAEIQYHRLCLRARPASRQETTLPWVRLARRGEEDVFSLNKDGFINLDFFGKRPDEFLPLFVAIESPEPEGNGRIVLLKIEALLKNGVANLFIKKVSKSQVPCHLKKAVEERERGE